MFCSHCGHTAHNRFCAHCGQPLEGDSGVAVALVEEPWEEEVRYEALVGSIQKMLPELAKKHQGKRIDFEVVVKDGRVGLKPKAT